MPDAPQPASGRGPLPRGTSWPSTAASDARWKLRTRAPGPSEAYTDAVRFLALYCEAHGKPLLARQLRRGHIQASPMGGTKPPQLPEQPVGVIRAEQLVRLLKACEGRDFTSRRNTAIILLLVDTGIRRADCVGMIVDDVDLDQRMVRVLGKGHRPRALPLGRKTAQALDRYLRVREELRLAYLPNLWVGRNGP